MGRGFGRGMGRGGGGFGSDSVNTNLSGFGRGRGRGHTPTPSRGKFGVVWIITGACPCALLMSAGLLLWYNMPWLSVTVVLCPLQEPPTPDRCLVLSMKIIICLIVLIFLYKP